jgi:hypothetical protein
MVLMALALLTILVQALPISAQNVQTVQCEDSQVGAQALWDGPVLSTSKEAGLVNCGESVTILSPVEQMTKIRTKDGKEGYVPGRYFGFKEGKEGYVPGRYFGFKVKPSRGDKNFQKIQSKHPDWSPAIVEAVMHHQVVVGMTYDMLHDSIGGIPVHVNETHLAGGHTSTQLVYEPCDCASDLLSSWHFSGYVYLEDGIVTAFQTTY